LPSVIEPITGAASSKFQLIVSLSAWGFLGLN
jgi:hypothetical protein